jgi:hypothetical protein
MLAPSPPAGAGVVPRAVRRTARSKSRNEGGGGGNGGGANSRALMLPPDTLGDRTAGPEGGARERPPADRADAIVLASPPAADSRCSGSGGGDGMGAGGMGDACSSGARFTGGLSATPPASGSMDKLTTAPPADRRGLERMSGGGGGGGGSDDADVSAVDAVAAVVADAGVRGVATMGGAALRSMCSSGRCVSGPTRGEVASAATAEA